MILKLSSTWHRGHGSGDGWPSCQPKPGADPQHTGHRRGRVCHSQT